MLRLVICEFRKLKRKKMFFAAFLTTFIMPVMYTLILTDQGLDNMMSVIREENGFMVLIPLSVIVAANLFFEEQDHDTLKNLMCVPVSRGMLAAAKIFVLLIFNVCYELTGFAVGLLFAALSGAALDGWTMQLFLTAGTGILLWAAEMPCLLLVVWCNKSYIISVIIAFAYTVVGYLMHVSDAFLRVPLGVNAATFLPVPMIFRWLYQFHSMEGAGETMRAFYEGFQPYFVSTPAVFAVLMAEAAVCMLLLVGVYQKQEI